MSFPRSREFRINEDLCIAYLRAYLIQNMNKKILRLPTPKLINKYIKNFEANKRYAVAYRIIEGFVNLKQKKTLDKIYIEVSLINSMYSTNVFNTFKMANHIFRIDHIDRKLLKGDVSLINEIGRKHKINKSNFFSFATKYCSFYNPDNYPMYDRYVGKIFWKYLRLTRKQMNPYTKKCRKVTREEEFVKFLKKDYMNFKRIHDDFRKHYGLSKYSNNELDRFLWLYGKYLFDNKNTS